MKIAKKLYEMLQQDPDCSEPTRITIGHLTYYIEHELNEKKGRFTKRIRMYKAIEDTILSEYRCFYNKKDWKTVQRIFKAIRIDVKKSSKKIGQDLNIIKQNVNYSCHNKHQHLTEEIWLSYKKSDYHEGYLNYKINYFIKYFEKKYGVKPNKLSFSISNSPELLSMTKRKNEDIVSFFFRITKKQIQNIDISTEVKEDYVYIIYDEDLD